MTDKEALLSIINTNFNLCSQNYDDYEIRQKEIEKNGIYACTFCKYNKIEEESDYPCWQHKIADWILEVLPLFDICKKK